VAAGLLPGERAVLHERAARALASAGDPALAAEVAGHWQAAGRPAEELPARVAAAGNRNSSRKVTHPGFSTAPAASSGTKA